MSYTLRQNPADVSNYTKGRTKAVDRIVIHHAATTSFDGIGTTFKNPSRNASAHFGVGRNGNVDQYVDVANTAWHAGNWDVNCSSIGIENVNSTGAPDWGIDEATVDTLVELVYDLAKQNGLLPLSVGKNLFGHKDFSSTACPGQLYGRLGEIASRVNAMSGDGNIVVTPKPNKPDQVLHVGEKFKFTKTYLVDDLQKINGTWQVRTNELCPVGFTWNDNGIPVEPLTEVAGGTGNGTDQRLQVGSKYKIDGTFTVLDLGAYQGRWLAKIKMGVWTLWVDIATVTEV